MGVPPSQVPIQLLWYSPLFFNPQIWFSEDLGHYWLVVWNMTFMTFHILGISSSQLTNIFQRGRYTTNQMNMGSRLNFTGVLKAVDGICSQDHDSTMF